MIYKCIYCQEEKDESGFRKTEHVLSQSFGKFDNNLTLNTIVCDLCNQFFGDNLEIDLARDTYEGLARFDHGVKKPEEFKSIGKRSRMKMKVAEGRFKGALVYPEYYAEIDAIAIRPFRQIGFRHPDTGEYAYFQISELPSKAELERENFCLDEPKSVIAIGMNAAEANQLLTGRGIHLKSLGDAEGLPPGNGEWDVEVEGYIDAHLARAYCKIAFNYLAYREGYDLVSQESFNPIRQFIRYGEIPVIYPIQIGQRPILAAELDSEQRRPVHMITMNWNEDILAIVSMVTLFNYATYSIVLALDYKGIDVNLGYGSLFDPFHREIHELAPGT